MRISKHARALFAQTSSILPARTAQERAQPVESYYLVPQLEYRHLCTLRTLLAATTQDTMMTSAAAILVVIIGAATTVAGQNT